MRHVIDIVPNRSSPLAVLLRESYREGGKVKKRTLANLSKLSIDQVQLLRRVLRGEKLVGVDDLFEAIRSAHYGHVQAVGVAMRRLLIPELIAATERELGKVQGMVDRGRLLGKDKIGLRVGRVVNKYRVAKHFDLMIEDAKFSFRVNQERVARKALDGLYVIRTSLPEGKLVGEDAVRSYKLLSQVERAFRSLKSLELLWGPMFHRLWERVRAHIFLCMLAYYAKWHMKEAWRELLWNMRR